jgi:pimeloyl-ACP methyl ester carboxylesterase
MKKIYPIFFSLAAFVIGCKSGNEKKASTQGAKASNNGVNISFNDTGKSDTVLLFVHGWAINKNYWQDQVNHFKERFRVVTIDLPGFGESGKNRRDWSVAEFGRDVDSVMQQLDLKNVILIGHSMSGNIVLEAALNAPQRVIGIVGVDNFKTFGEVPDSNFKKVYAQVIDSMRKNYSGVVVEYFGQQLFSKSTDSATKKRILNDVLHSDSTIAVDVMAQMDYDETGKAKSYHKPIFLVNSDYTPTDTLGFKKAGVPFGLYIVHGTGHYPMIEKPEEFNQQLEGVIKKIGDTGN